MKNNSNKKYGFVNDNNDFENTFVSQILNNVNTFIHSETYTELEEIETIEKVSLYQYIKEHDLLNNKSNNNTLKIPIEEWNIKTGMNVSFENQSDLEKLNSIIDFEDSVINVREESQEELVELITENWFYKYTQKVKKTINKTYIVVGSKY